MSKKTISTGARPRAKTTFQVKTLSASVIAAVVLEELSRDYADVCNFAAEVSLVRSGDLCLALWSVQDAKRKLGLSSTEVSARSVWVYSQAVSVLKKCIDPSYDLWGATSTLWFRTEDRCMKLNRKFTALTARKSRGVKPLPFSRELYRFYEGLLYVLGSEVPIDDVLAAAHYGPGSTTGVRGQDVNFVRKVESNECVPLCVDLAARALVFDKAVWSHLGMDATYSHVPSAQEGFIRVAREQLLASVVSHDRLMFIPKDMTSLRSIGAQPTCSGMVQLGVHTVGARLLLKAGIDLSDQGWNQRLAFEGSRDWDQANPWCTLDKSNASNLIANNLVKYLFPPVWAKFLQRTRTPGYEAPPQLGGGLHDYHMYAGMGNGTTFFVETLIFWAATYATQDLPVEEYVRKRPYAVYGDDVILRRDHAERYIPFARFLGFRFNAKKTFLEGPFRESCGADYYKGVNVRAATLLPLENGNMDLPSLISFHNNLADHPVFALNGACERIRRLSQTHLYPILPTDPAGDLGYRPVDRAFYNIVKDANGNPALSEPWQRPRTYTLEVKPKWGSLGNLDPWTQLAVALLRARQAGPSDDWSLPIRGLVNYRVIAERDLERDDLKVMLLNQLRRLSVRKDTPWWNDSRGFGRG